VLFPLDDWIASRGFDTSKFFPGYLDAFKGKDGKIYGLPKDGNTLALAYNPDMLSKAGITAPPTTLDELTAASQKIKAAGMTPMCLSQSLDRSLAFIYANGGGLFNADKTQSDLDNPGTAQGITYYLDLFKQGYGQSPSQLSDDWCGKALGEKKVAMIFEGGWLDAFMQSTYPDVKYTWAPLPKGVDQATLGFTVSYSIGKDSPNKDAAWVLMTYLTGQQGMSEWVAGKVALPSREDVSAPAGSDVLVQSAQFAKPWSFIPGFSKVNDAYNNALTAAIQNGGSATDVINKTKPALDAALAGS
jgi:multiple sugar transport system substrate-binding protein